MMRPPRSRRILAQRKFAQGAYVPPSVAPAPTTNGDRRDNNPSGRNFIIQHQVGPSVFVDYISYQGLELHHKGLQPFVMVKRLEEVPTSVRDRRTEFMRNRELVRNRELDKNRDLKVKNVAVAKNKEHINRQTITNRESSRNKDSSRNKESNRNKDSNKCKRILTNKDSDKNKDTTTNKDAVRNKNNVKNIEGSNKEIAKHKNLVTEKDIVKKKDVTKNKLTDNNKEISKNKEKAKLLTNKSNREKPHPKPLHVMSLRSRRLSKLEFNKKEVASRVTRLSVARRNVAKALEEPAKQEKKNIAALKSSKCRNPVSSEFSLDDNRPLTYFAKGSTPKRPPVAPVPRVSLVPLTSATATNTTEPVAGPSGLTELSRTPKTKTNPYVLLPNISSAPLPAQTLAKTQKKPVADNDAPTFYGEPNIYRWMNKSLNNERGLTARKSKPAPKTLVRTPCPALQWHTVKELNNAEKSELEARCLKCDTCKIIEKSMKLSETLKSLLKFDVSGDENEDDTAEPKKQKGKVSSNGIIYMELLPKIDDTLVKVRTRNVLGKNVSSACLIPRAHARQIKSFTLVEQMTLLKQINATLMASAKAAKCSGRLVLESVYETDSSIDEPIPESSSTFNMKLRYRRRSVCADSVTQQQSKPQRRKSVCTELACQPKPKPQRRKSVCTELACQPKPKPQRRKSVFTELACQQKPKPQRRKSICAELALQPQPKPQRRQSVCAESALQQQPKPQRRQSVCAESALEQLPKLQKRPSVCAESGLQQQPKLQRRQSVCAESALQQQPQPQRRQSVCAESALQQQPQRLENRRESVFMEKAMQEKPQPQRLQSGCAESAMQQQLQRLGNRRESVFMERAMQEKPQPQRLQSGCAESAMQQQLQRLGNRRESVFMEKAMQEIPQPQRRQSVYAESAMQQQLQRLGNRRESVFMERAMQEEPQPQRLQSGCAESAMQQQLQRLGNRRESVFMEKAMQEIPQPQRRQSVCAESAMQQQLQRLGNRRESVFMERAMQEEQQPQRLQSFSEELAMQQQPQLQSRESVSAEMPMLVLPQQQLYESVSSGMTLQAQPRQGYNSDCAEFSMQAQPQQEPSVSVSPITAIMPQLRRKWLRSQNRAFGLKIPKTIVEVPEMVIDEQSTDIYVGNNDRAMVWSSEAVTDTFDASTVRVSSPIGNFDMDRLKSLEPIAFSESNIQNLSQEELHERVEEAFAGQDDFFSMIAKDSGPQGIYDVENSAEESSELLNVAVKAGNISPVQIDESSLSSFKLVYDDSADSASEARMMAEVDEQARALDKEEDAKAGYSQDKGHSSGADPNPSSGFPNSAEGAQIVDAPVFHPTNEEFDDPIAYFEKILPIAYKYGICKVVPPEGWKPKCKISEDIRFDVSNQYVSRLYCRWGPASRELSALKLCLQQQNVNVTRPPLVDGVEVNLPKLYHLVQRHGGLENVINKNRWDKVAEEMRLNKAPVIEKKLDQHYVKYLLPYATLDHNERQEIMKKVEMAWQQKNQKLLDRATNPLHRQKRMLGESESSDGETEDEGTANALADAEDCVVPGFCMNFSKFKKVATNAYENHIGIEQPGADIPSIESIEERYWRHVVTGTEHICVNSAAIDTGEEGHGFTKNKNESYGRHPWNLKNVSENPGNILRYLGPVLGMTVPTLHLAMIFSTSCWHKDPHALPWTEFMHRGRSKIWYGIPDEQSDNFRKAVETLAPTSCQNKTLWLSSDIAMIPPQILREHNVSLARTVQNPGEFILVFPKAYSCSISTGYTESESVYFAPRSWLENLSQVIQETRESCEPTMFSLEQLLILMCQDPNTEPKLLNMVKPTLDKIVGDELSYRRLLQEKGLKFLSENDIPSTSHKRYTSAYNMHDQDECEYCRATLYLSKVRGLTGKKSSLCLEHALLLLDSSKYKEVNVAQLEVFVYMTSEELSDLATSVEERLFSASS